MSGSHSHRLQQGAALLFLTLWFLYGLLIQSWNLGDFNLQQMGVEAIVERGHFYLEGSRTPQLQPNEDVFEYRGHLYAAKQPGQFLAGALVYVLLHALGLSYLQQYTLTAALVTFFTTSLVTAAASVAVFQAARLLAGPTAGVLWPLGTALVYGVATTALPYAGIAHHDAIGAGYLAIAFSCLVRLAFEPQRVASGWRAAVAGVFLGLAVTTSTLSLLVALLLSAYFLSLRQWRLLPAWLLGCLLGVLPLLVYDAVNFGNPFLLPNIAGGFWDTYFSLDRANFLTKARFYATSITWYVPVAWLALVGAACLPRRVRREQVTLLAIVGVLVGYVVNIDTFGHCQYGPRYLLPAMPFAALGLVGLASLRPRAVRWAAGAGSLLVGLFSAAVNIVGAMGGALYCEIESNAFPRYLAGMRVGPYPEFPLIAGLAIPFTLCLAGLVWWAWTEARAGIVSAGWPAAGHPGARELTGVA